MEKRYQVFVSSTFTDLEKERQEIIQILPQFDCIPAGMELFPASDDDQWAFIQKVIDDCDYYLLVVGGRYGSPTPDGVSYTEKEHDYAVSKEIPVIALLHGDTDEIPSGKTEANEEARAKLKAFRERVSTGRLVKYWKSQDELIKQMMLSLSHAMKAHPRPGWVRGGSVANPQLLEQNNVLHQKVADLQARLTLALETRPAVLRPELASGEAKFELEGRYMSMAVGQSARARWRALLSWNEIIGLVGSGLIGREFSSESTVKEKFIRLLSSMSGESDDIEIDTFHFEKVKIHLHALEYISITEDSNHQPVWTLTPLGMEAAYAGLAEKNQNNSKSPRGGRMTKKR
jgi:hypothetical protein